MARKLIREDAASVDTRFRLGSGLTSDYCGAIKNMIGREWTRKEFPSIVNLFTFVFALETPP